MQTTKGKDPNINSPQTLLACLYDLSLYEMAALAAFRERATMHEMGMVLRLQGFLPWHGVEIKCIIRFCSDISRVLTTIATFFHDTI